MIKTPCKGFSFFFYNPFKYGIDIDIKFRFEWDFKYGFFITQLVFIFFCAEYYWEGKNNES